MKLTNKIQQIYNRLKAAGKVTTLPPDEVQRISDDIDRDMVELNRELVQKAAQSERDTAEIIVSNVASSLALALMQEKLAEGHSIEIPSLGITIEPEEPTP